MSGRSTRDESLRCLPIGTVASGQVWDIWPMAGSCCEVRHSADRAACQAEVKVRVKRYVAAAVSLFGAWILASILVASLSLVGFDPAASAAITWQQYSTYRAVEILLLMIVLTWALLRIIGRHVFGFEPDERPFVERLPAWVRHPSPRGLVITWIVAPFTVVLYPVAAYMSWRFYAEWRANARTCPRCAERIKSEALVCRHCGHEFEPVVSPAGAVVPN